MKQHEDVLIFSTGLNDYFPQGLVYSPHVNRRSNSTENYGKHDLSNYSEFTNYPKDVLNFNREVGLHPTQKPVALFEYLIKTYTNEGDLVLDNCAGSGTTGVACENLQRNSILMEQEPEYCTIIRNRLHEVTTQQKLKIEA